MRVGITNTLKNALGFGNKPNPQEKVEDVAFSVVTLHKSKATTELIAAHQSVVRYYDQRMAKMAQYHDFMHPDKHWSDDEMEILRAKRKAAIAFSLMQSSMRTYVGAMAQNKYSVTPAPVDPSDQSYATVYKALYHQTAHNASVKTKDLGLLQESWITGSAWQESFTSVGQNGKPCVFVNNLNSFCMYPDPNRRDLVTNSDCKFIDRVGFYTLEDIISCYPDKEEEIRESLTNPQSISYTNDSGSADRSHERLNTKNGRFKIIERQYKVVKIAYYTLDEQGNRQDLGFDIPLEKKQEIRASGTPLLSDSIEYLYHAVCCPLMNTYIFNGEHKYQPREPLSGKIMFTWLELIDEAIGGVPSGHVEHMIGPNKVVDALMVNTLSQAKNASGQSRIGNPDAFEEHVMDDVAKNASDSDRFFWKKRGFGDQNPISLIPQGTLTADTDKGINFAMGNLQDNSSTPPSMKGFAEGNVPAALNQQRIQQSYIQSQVQVENYMSFMRQRGRLWIYFWNTEYTEEMVIRSLEPSMDGQGGENEIAINKLVQDKWGNPQRENLLSEAAAHDIVFEDSFESPTARAQSLKMLNELMATNAVANDPTITAMLSAGVMRLSDLPANIKDKAIAYLDGKVQQAQQPQEPPVEKPKISVSLKGEMHDPATLSLLVALGNITQEQADQMLSNPVSQTKQKGDEAAAHGKVLENFQKVHDTQYDERQQDFDDRELSMQQQNARELTPA